MTSSLPPNLLQLFAPDNPIPYLQPAHLLPHEKRPVYYSGVSYLLSLFEDPKDTPPPHRIESSKQLKKRMRKEKMEKNAKELEKEIEKWEPLENSKATKDPYKTLFVARLSYDLTESDIRHEFEAYGKIKRIKMVNDDSGDSRGYCFIEYDRERDMKNAYKRSDGKKIYGRRVLVDYERGRTVKGWKPRRLGGGLGGESRVKKLKRGERDSSSSSSIRKHSSSKKHKSHHSRSRSRSRDRR